MTTTPQNKHSSTMTTALTFSGHKIAAAALQSVVSCCLRGWAKLKCACACTCACSLCACVHPCARASAVCGVRMYVQLPGHVVAAYIHVHMYMLCDCMQGNNQICALTFRFLLVHDLNLQVALLFACTSSLAHLPEHLHLFWHCAAFKVEFPAKKQILRQNISFKKIFQSLSWKKVHKNPKLY